jgi:hypothetical protein
VYVVNIGENMSLLEIRHHLIRNEEDLQKFLDELSRHDILGYIRQQRPDTKWVVHLLSNVTFYVNKINEYPKSGGCYIV